MNATIVAIVPEATQTYSFYLEPENELNYKSGDFIYLILPLLKYPDLKGNIRQFSLASSPSEGNILRITSHEGISGYKKTLMSLNVGDIVEIQGPQGVYPWPPKNLDTSHVFIAGGIGITPIRSRIKYILDNKLEIKFTVIYSVKTNDHLLFEDDIKHQAFHLITTTSQPRINREYLEPIVSKNENATFWVTGSTGFVSDLQSLLYNLGVNEDQIKTEKFTGY